MKFTSFVYGFNTLEKNPHTYAGASGADFIAIDVLREAWMKKHYIAFHHHGKLKPETVHRMAARRCIVTGLRAYAISFDPSGKGRHIIHKIEV